MKQRIFVATLGLAIAATALGASARPAFVGPVQQSIPSGAPTVFTSPIPSPTAT